MDKAQFSEDQRRAVKELLWDSLHRDPEHPDRRRTGWGTKTLPGLIACIERICTGNGKLPKMD